MKAWDAVKIFLLMVAFMVTQVNAQMPGVVVTPIPVSSCGQYMASRRGADIQSQINSGMAVTWLWGFLSRYSVESDKNPITIPAENETMHLLLEKYCRQNPVGGLADASFAIIRELGGNPAKSISKSK